MKQSEIYDLALANGIAPTTINDLFELRRTNPAAFSEEWALYIQYCGFPPETELEAS